MNHHIKESVPAPGTYANGLVRDKRRTWKNCVCNQIVEPLLYVKPGTLEELIQIIKDAQKDGCKVKAVGSGHSFSDIVQTSDYLVDCHSLNHPIPLEKELLHSNDVLIKNGYSADHLVHVENGITISDLNEHLDKNKLALINMGAYDGQTIAGVISTSTHGTGITLGPIAGSVVCMVLVGERGTVYRIEPKDGITDPAKYKAKFPENELVQSDEFFNAVLVSMGCMGVMYSVILRTRNRYFLHEERRSLQHETYWEDLKKGGHIEELLATNRHLEIWVNPYKINGRHECLVTKRNIYDGEIKRLSLKERSRKWLVENVLLKFRRLPILLLTWFYRKTPQLISAGMRGILDDDGYIDKSYKVMNLGNANYVKGYAAEYAVSLRNNRYMDAIDTILEQAEKNKALGDLYHTAPVSMRFVKKCEAHLSMMNGEDKCLIEVPLLVGTKGRFQILDKIEHELFKLGNIRPHWGQYHNLGEDTIRALYPELDNWLRIYKQMNTTGIFKNTFTDRCGFDG